MEKVAQSLTHGPRLFTYTGWYLLVGLGESPVGRKLAPQLPAYPLLMQRCIRVAVIHRFRSANLTIAPWIVGGLEVAAAAAAPCHPPTKHQDHRNHPEHPRHAHHLRVVHASKTPVSEPGWSCASVMSVAKRKRGSLERLTSRGGGDELPPKHLPENPIHFERDGSCLLQFI